MQAPLPMTLTPAAAASHALAYVTWLHPHTGSTLFVHKRGFSAQTPVLPQKLPTLQYSVLPEQVGRGPRGVGEQCAPTSC